VLCRYYMAGTCRAGQDCTYSHDRSISNRGTLPCRFFRSGTCANGNNCRFSHGPVTDPPQLLEAVKYAPQLMPDMESGVDLSMQVASLSLDPTSTPYFPTTSPTYHVSVTLGGHQNESSFPGHQNDSSLHSHNLSPLSPSFEPISGFEPSFDPLTPSFEPSSFNSAPKPQYTTLGPTPEFHAPADWAEAPEFVPGGEASVARSWAEVVNPSGGTYEGCEVSVSEAESQLCPFWRVGECRYGAGCVYIHGETCDYCGQASLHPGNSEQRRKHLRECVTDMEKDMETSFAVARSKEKTCGICMEVVLDKPKGEARFGILPACTHCFCLPCIRKWRQAKQFEHKIIRACPECRQKSDYICPSRFWCETKEEKERLLSDYKMALNGKECKYFNKGEGECPFGNKCFYRHANIEGRDVDVGPPKKPVRRANADGNLTLVQRLLLYDFLEEREERLVLPLDYIELLDLFSDSDEWSGEEEGGGDF